MDTDSASVMSSEEQCRKRKSAGDSSVPARCCLCRRELTKKYKVQETLPGFRKPQQRFLCPDCARAPAITWAPRCGRRFFSRAKRDEQQEK